MAEQNAALTALNVTLRETQARQAAMLHVREKVHSIISHDLRAPINGMVGYLNLLLETPEDFGADDIANFARKMLQSTMRLSEMMENLLRWSLFHSGELVCNPIILHLDAHVDRCMALYGEAAAKKEITLHNELAAAYTLWADQEMVDFIMRNLTTNAIKFTKPGGHVRYAAAPTDDGFLAICVQDDGVGMTMEQVNRILEKGEHVTTSGTQKEKGTGFGLMLCRDFVQHQGGKLTVESRPGHGTQVRFTLPMQTVGE
jgi:signal transduction histidine kinase